MPFSIKISPMDIYITVQLKANINTFLSDYVDESIHLWLDKLWEKGWKASYDQMPGEEACGGYTISSCSSWQQQVSLPCKRGISFINQNIQLMLQYGDTACLN